MYGQGSVASGVGGTVSVLGASMVLPNTSGNPLLFVLSVTTIVIGLIVVTSFFVSRYVAARSSK